MMNVSGHGRPEPAAEWLVCLGRLRKVTDEIVACPLAADGQARFEDCLNCRHLEVLADDRDRESCSTDDPFR